MTTEYSYEQVKKAKDFIWKNLDEKSREIVMTILSNNENDEKSFKVKFSSSVKLDIDLV